MKGSIIPIDYKTAVDFLLPKHYSGRIPQISEAYGWYDCDGFLSASMAYLYLKHIGINNIIVLHHTNKEHGLSDEIMAQIEPNSFIWIPDAGSSDIEQ